MQGLDTNVLLRYLVADEPQQSARAARFINATCTVDTPCWVNRVVLCEAVWVLEDAYGYARAQIATALDAVLRTREFLIEDQAQAQRALAAYRTEGADFADFLIGETNAAAGCDTTVTFDRKAAASTHFTPVP